MALSVGELVGYLRLDSAGFDAGIVSAQRQMAGAAASAERMGAAVGTSEAALAGAGRMADVAASGSARLRAAQLSVVAAQERYNLLLADGDASIGRMAAAEASLVRANERVRASTPVFTPMAASAKVASAEVAGLTSRIGASALSMAKMGLGFAVFAAAFKVGEMVKSANSFQRAMLLIQTQAGATSAEVKKMTPAILSLAGQVATAPEKLATSLYHVESVGLRGAKALDAVKIAAEGAKVGNADLEQTTNALTAAVASGAKGTQNMSQAMGALNSIVGAGDMKLQDLNDALSSGILVVAKQFGVTLTDVGAALATFGDNNIRGANAATMLRTAINAMAKPVAGGAAELKALGMTAGQLATDMSTGGLGKALVDLKAHLSAAGITGAKVGDVLLTAFGKKAGPGISVLIDQLGRFQTKTADINAGSATFGQQWAATTHTAAFGFEKLGASVEAAAISMYSKAGPALGSVAGALGTQLPSAIAALNRILGPLEHEVGVVLVGAWKAAGVVLAAAAVALGAVGHVLEANKGLVKDLGTAVLGVWATFKGVALASAALSALSGAFTALTTRVLIAKDAMMMYARGTAMMSMSKFAAVVAAFGLAVYEVGKHISNATEANNSFAQAMNNSKAAEDSFRQALDQSNGAIDANVVKSVAMQLQQDGIAGKAAKAGVSLAQLVTGVTGSTSAFAGLVDQWKAGGKPSGDTLVALGLLRAEFGGVAGQTKAAAGAVTTILGPLGALPAPTAAAAAALKKVNDAAAAGGALLGVTADAYTAAATTAAASTTATAAQTLAFQLENNAAGLVNTALATMAGQNLSIAQAKTADAQATMTLTAAFKANGAAISDNTTKGLANQTALEGKASSLRSVLTAEAAGSMGTAAATREYHKNADAILAQIGKQYGLTSSIYKYAASILTIPKVALTKADLQKAAAEKARSDWLHGLSQIPPAKYTRIELAIAQAAYNARVIQDRIDNLHGKTVTVTVETVGNLASTYRSQVPAAARAYGGTAAGGVTVGGVGGPKSDSNLFWLSKGEEVIQEPYASRYRSLLKSINSGSFKGITMPAAAAAPGGGAGGGVNVAAPNVNVTVLLDGKQLDHRTDIRIGAHLDQQSNALTYGYA